MKHTINWIQELRSIVFNVLFHPHSSPHYFKDIKISALSLLKMVMHARSGGTLEVMGLLLGKVDANTMIVMDSFALPVEGTETRVNAQAQAYEYMASYTESAKQVGRLENVIGWYHSHPGTLGRPLHPKLNPYKSQNYRLWMLALWH